MALQFNDKAAAELEKYESLRPLQYSYGGKLIEVRYDEKEQVMYSKDPQTGRIKKTAVDSEAFWKNVSQSNTVNPIKNAASPITREKASDRSQVSKGVDASQAAKSSASGVQNYPAEAATAQTPPDATDEADDADLPTDTPQGSSNGCPPQGTQTEQDAPDDAAPEQRPRRSKKPILILLAILIIVGTILFRAGKIYLEAMPRETTPQESTAQTLAPTEDGTEPIGSEDAESSSATESISGQAEMVSVLTAKSTMLPGHVLVKNDFATTEMSTREYQALMAAGGYYKESDLSLLEGFVVVDYIPMGSCIQNDAVAAQYAPVNPWGKTTEQQVVVTLPITVTPETLTGYLWGKSLDITVRTETKVELPVSPQEDPPEEAGNNTPDGIQHESSTVEAIQADTYILRAATIIDVLDEQKESLFSQYASLTSAPAPYRPEIIAGWQRESIEGLVPVYIKVAVPAEQGLLLNELEGSNMTLTFDAVGENCTTTLQADAFTSLQDVAVLLAGIWMNGA